MGRRVEKKGFAQFDSDTISTPWVKMAFLRNLLVFSFAGEIDESEEAGRDYIDGLPGDANFWRVGG